jgi:serine/threonine protein phosphatase PrpC
LAEGDILRFESTAATHAGAVRRLNEDSFLDNPGIGLWVVADGVGGHARGDYASQTLVAALSSIGRQESALDLLTAVRHQVATVNANLRAFAENEGVDLSATTMAALLCFGRHYAVVWAGDSRVYLLRDSQLRQLTRDHTMVQELLEIGAISSEEALHHPQRNVVTRAVGAGSELELETVKDRLQPGDVFLLCSDGLGKVVADDEIAAMLQHVPAAAVPGRLIDQALERGSPDNVTVVLVECRE